MSKLVEIFHQVRNVFLQPSTERDTQKAQFVEKYLKNLDYTNLTFEQQQEWINKCLMYSSQGVFESLLFNKALDNNVKNLIKEQIESQSSIYGLSELHTSFISEKNNIVKAFFVEKHSKKFVCILSGDNYSNIEVRPYSDISEIKGYLKDTAIKEINAQFQLDKITVEDYIKNYTNIVGVDNAFNLVIKSSETDKLQQVFDVLQQSYNIPDQLDKILRISERQNQDVGDVGRHILTYLSNENKLDAYIHSRINKRSVLSEYCQEQLMVESTKIQVLQNINSKKIDNSQSEELSHNILSNNAEDELVLSNMSENTLEPVNGLALIKTLGDKYETLFKKTTINTEAGETYFWENSDRTVKIHPGKILVPIFSKESTALALDAAVHNFGNTLTISGTEDFKDSILNILSTVDYKHINLTNENLQEKLDTMRGINNVISLPDPIKSIEHLPVNIDTNSGVIEYFKQIDPKLVETVLASNEIMHESRGMILLGKNAQENPKLLFELFALKTGIEISDCNQLDKIKVDYQLQKQNGITCKENVSERA
ncbi:MAG: hypothetical protein K2P99_01715 [Burkholderiales bacterium]|nr:hypothetical protein [Burkholderiales bacterium]